MSEKIDYRSIPRGSWQSLAQPGESARNQNVYVDGLGYVTDHIDPRRDRSNLAHWKDQWLHSSEFQESWHPRPGVLDLIDQLAKRHRQTGDTDPFRFVNTGAGAGGLSLFAAHIPGVIVDHVDFSDTANNVARAMAERYGVGDRIKIVTADNQDYLDQLANNPAHMVAIYGSGGENIPLIRDIEHMLVRATNALREGGLLLYVGLVQPALIDPSDTSATDILGEYPTRPGLIQEIVQQIPDMYLIRDNGGNEKRDDKHRLNPLDPEGKPEEHTHKVLRAAWGKQKKGEIMASLKSLEFDFKEPPNKQEWDARWAGYYKPLSSV